MASLTYTCPWCGLAPSEQLPPLQYHEGPADCREALKDKLLEVRAVAAVQEAKLRHRIKGLELSLADIRAGQALNTGG